MHQAISSLLFLFFISPLVAEIGISFPEKTDLPNKPAFPLKRKDLPKDNLPKLVRIEEKEVYYASSLYYKQWIKKTESFDKIKEGMTLREIVDLLGPGCQDILSGIGLVIWECEDGRTLKLLPPSPSLDRKGDYFVETFGNNERHKEVAALSKSLISSLDIQGQIVEVAFSKDTHAAKAFEKRRYTTGERFHGPNDNPRIHFRITKIENNSIHCDYYYRPAPNGSFHYAENGNIIFSKKSKTPTAK